MTNSQFGSNMAATEDEGTLPCGHNPGIEDVKAAIRESVDLEELARSGACTICEIVCGASASSALARNFKLVEALLKLSPCRTMNFGVLAKALEELDSEKDGALPGA